MGKKWLKKLLVVGMQWKYGQKDRDESGEKLWFYETLCKVVQHVETYWYDDYIGDQEKMQRMLVQKAEQFKPDLILFFPHNDQFTFETLDFLKEKYTTYAWFGDDGWRFESYTSRYAPHYTYVSTTDCGCIEKYKKLGIEPILSQWAGQTYSSNIGPLRKNEKYLMDVSFVGGYNDYRGWFIQRLKELGIDVQCFGAGWPNSRVSFAQMEQIFRVSKINLNISNSANNDIRFVLCNEEIHEAWKTNPKRAEQIKARNFEIPLSGGFQLTNYVLHLEDYLKIGDEVAVYTTPEECAQQIQYFLQHQEKREKIVQKSHERAHNEHTYEQRMRDVLNSIWVTRLEDKKIESETPRIDQFNHKKSLAVYWSVATNPPSDKDAIFDPDSMLNRDDCMKVYRLLHQYIEEAGAECHTLDVFQERNIKPDIVLFLEIPGVPLEFILGKWTNQVLKYVILYESQVILPRNWDTRMHTLFDKIFTWNDDYIDNKKYFKINFSTNFPETINQDISKKVNFCTLVAGNKFRGHPLELYSKRIEAIRWFEHYHPQDFSFYGIGWDEKEYPSYKGAIQSKKQVLETYRFAICYENGQQINGYITEKILDCFAAGCVPIYWGAGNIEQHIPKECFIDKRDFSSYEDLYSYLKGMSDEVYQQYLYSIQAFLQSERIAAFTMENMPRQVVNNWKTDIKMLRNPQPVPAREIAVHYWQQVAVEKRLANEDTEAYEAIVKAYNAGKAANIDFSEYMFVITELALILNKMKKNDKVIEVCQEGLKLGKEYIDLYFLLSQAHLELGNLQECMLYCEKYLALFNRYAEVEKDAYTIDYFLTYYKEVTALLVKLYEHFSLDDKAMTLFFAVDGKAHICELFSPMLTIFERNGRVAEFLEYYENQLAFRYPELAKQFAPRIKQYSENETATNKEKEKSLTELILQLEILLQKGYGEEALSLIAEYQSLGQVNERILAIKAAIYRKQFGLN
ncbi:MAG: glycosyltransferase [Pelosinus sp.]|nr:glycosyltransferase [Pelosinus sp.]